MIILYLSKYIVFARKKKEWTSNKKHNEAKKWLKKIIYITFLLCMKGQHYFSSYKKVSQITFIDFSSRGTLRRRQLIPPGSAPLRQHLEYWVQHWAPQCKENIDILEQVQYCYLPRLHDDWGKNKNRFPHP